MLNDSEKKKKLYEYILMTLFILIILLFTCKNKKNIKNEKKKNDYKNFGVLLINIIEIFKSKEIIKENLIFTNCIIFGCFFFYLNSKIKK